MARGLSVENRPPIAATYEAYARMPRERRRAEDADRVEGLSMGLR